MLHRSATGAAILASLLVVAAPAAAAETAAVSLAGVVVDGAGAPVAAASVLVRDGSGGLCRTRSGDDGRFRCEPLSAGAASVAVSASGWQPTEVSVTLPGAGDELRVVLSPASVEETVVVIGATSGRRSLHPQSADLPASVDVIGADQLARENVDLSYELLKKVPGVNVADYNQGVVSGGIGIRGFNTEGDIMHTKLLIDGIPSNTNSGVGLIDAIFPLAIDRIEIVKGTTDPRYGLLNVAGNIQVMTSPPGRYTRARLLGGAYGTRDFQAVTAFSTARLSHVYFGGYRRSDGYRDNADLDRSSLSGKWLYTPAAGGWALSATARAYDFDTQAPGYLTPAEVAANPRQSPAFSATDGGRQQTRHVSLHLDRQFSSALALSVKAYRQAFEQQRWVRFTAAGAQQERLEDETQTGALVTLTWRPAAWASRDATLSSGADVQVQDNMAQRYRTVARARTALLRDHAFDFSNGGAYVMADTRPVSWLRVNGGVRADRVGGGFADGLSRAQLPAIDYGTIWQPRVGATAIVREGVTLYANYGRSFQVGVGSGAYSRTPLDHSKNDGWEAGVHLTPVPGLVGRVGVWGQDASDELRLKFDNSGDSENVGRTRRRGWNIEVTAKPHPTTFVWGTYTRQRATLVEPGPTQPELREHELNHVPHYTAKAGIDVTPSRVLSVSLWTEAQGDYYLTPANAPDRFGGRRLTNLDAFVRLRQTVTFGAHVKNLFNGYHEYAWFDGVTTLHSPGERRSVSVSSTVEF